METFTASQTIRAVQARERLPMHEVESQATADPSAQGHPILEASVHLLCNTSTSRLPGRPRPHASLCRCKSPNPHLLLQRLSYATV